MVLPRTLITGPTVEPVSLAEAKRHLRLTSDDTAKDGEIASLIVAARTRVQQDTNLALVTSTWETYLDCFPVGTRLELPLPPLQSVTHVKYTDTDAAETTVDGSYYHVDTVRRPGRIVLAYGQQWPTATLRTANGIVVRFVAGYAAYSGTVTTVATAVTKSTGSDFNVGWPAGHPVTINGVVYEIASVASTTAATLRSTAGTQASAVAYSTADVPADLRIAVLILIYHWFDQRGMTESVEEIARRDVPLSYKSIVADRKVYSFGA